MWNPPPVRIFSTYSTTYFAAYITYHQGVYPIDGHLQQMYCSDVVFLIPSWDRIGFHRQRLDWYKQLDCQVVLCANTPEEHQELLEAGCDAIYCNQNAWLDYHSIFTLQPSASPGCSCQGSHRQWNLVVNANSSSNKRTQLAAGVANRVHISYTSDGSAVEGAPCASWAGKCCVNRQQHGTYRYLFSSEVAGVLNSSSVGGIFSATEGACYASTEYLLCGLPVVSTASSGGRDIWYTPNNSIIVEATESAVAAGVQEAMVKLQTGEFDQAAIRSGAVRMAEQFRAKFVREIEVIDAERDDEFGALVDGNALLQQLCGVHKLGLV